MFTGIVEGVGSIQAVRPREGIRELEIQAPESVLTGLKSGASVAVDGACLTAVGVGEERFTAEVMDLTLARTLAGTYRTGSRVNLERALPMGGRLEGHLVQGHVDGVGRLLRRSDSGDHHLLDLEIPQEVHDLTILHGSIAVNGVSLTVSSLDPPDRVQVGIIPLTWKVTNLSLLKPGDPVNVEGDLIGKYVGKLWSHRNREER